MVDEITFPAAPLGPAGGLGPRAPSAPPPLKGPSFGEVLARKQGLGPQITPGLPLKLSQHAQTRLNSRGITLDEHDWERIKQGVDKAAAKGAKEALVLSEKAGLVVSIKNRTVITAVDPAALKDNVFTNIDAAVIV